MHVFLDTNIILDVLLKREGNYSESLTILEACEIGQYHGSVSLLTIANIHYIGKKLIGSENILKSIETIVSFIDVFDGNKASIESAIRLNFGDFEDALQYTIAIAQGKVDAIITRNVKDYKKSKIPVYTPTEWLRLPK